MVIIIINVKVKWFWMVFTDVFYISRPSITTIKAVNLSNHFHHSQLDNVVQFPYSQFNSHNFSKRLIILNRTNGCETNLIRDFHG